MIAKLREEEGQLHKRQAKANRKEKRRIKKEKFHRSQRRQFTFNLIRAKVNKQK